MAFSFDSGESVFSPEGDHALREVWVLRTRVEVLDFNHFRPQEKFLKETYQIMPDGRKREQDHGYWSLGKKLLPTEVEKVKKDEKDISALVRAVKEELSLDYYEAFYHHQSGCFGIEREDKMTKSYPGLKTYYFFQSWKIYMRPDYYSPGYTEVCDDGSKTYFEWNVI